MSRSRRNHSGLSRLFSRIQRAHELAEKCGMPVDEAYERTLAAEQVQRQQRRRFLKQMGAGVIAGTAAGPASMAMAAAATDPGRVAIIGGGLAGLRCAHKLWRKGFASKVFEASPRVGGRAFTKHGYFDHAPFVERGGEFVSSEHKAVARLCSRLGLELEDINGGAAPEGEELYYSNGELVTVNMLNDVWAGIRKTFKQTERAAPWQPMFNSFTEEHVRLDYLNVPDWLDEIGVGASSPVGGIFQADVISEYGLAPESQSALNLLYLLAWNPRSTALPLAGTDELYRIEGGSSALVTALVDALPGDTLSLEKTLVAVSGHANGPYCCHFDDGSSYVADQLVLTLPFSKLREVEFSNGIWESFIPEKRQAIENLVMGHNAKLHVETAGRPGEQIHNVGGEEVLTNGVSYSDENGFVTTWDSNSTGGPAGTVYTDYLGGHQGQSLGVDSPFSQARPEEVSHFLSQVEPVFPGIASAHTGKALASKWSDYEWAKGSYATPSLGDYTTFWGAQWYQESGNRIFFAGEHCSEEYWGFMNGAVQTGTRAAKALMGIS